MKVLEGGYGVCAKYWRRDLGGMRYLRKCSHNLSPLRQKGTKHVCPARMFSRVILFPCPSATGGRINGSGEYLVVGLVCAKAASLSAANVSTAETANMRSVGEERGESEEYWKKRRGGGGATGKESNGGNAKITTASYIQTLRTFLSHQRRSGVYM